jgi:hypothetical protein
MTHSINSLSLEDCISILISRLDLPEGEEATQEQLEAELEVYKAELIAEEEARLAEEARIADLKARFEALSDVGLIQGSMSISNPAAYFQSDILSAESEEAESKMAAMEQAYHALAKELGLPKDPAQMAVNSEAQAFLNASDWKILRHLREQALGIPTSLSSSEYLALEQERADAAARIIN